MLQRFFILFLTLLLSHCSRDEQGSGQSPKVVIQDSADNSAISVDTEGFSVDNPLSLTAFKDTVYPLLRQRCAQCHSVTTSPRHSDESPYMAHKVVVEAHLVSPSAPSSSRIVTRLAVNNHNCWSECPKDAKIMLDAVNAWIEQAKLTVSADNLKSTDPVAVKDALPYNFFGGRDGNWVREAENHEGLGLRRFGVVDDDTASQRKSLRQSRLPVGQNEENTTAEDEPSYSFAIAAGEKVALWMKVKDLGVGRRISYRINGGVPVDFYPQGSLETWTWIKLFDPRVVKPLAGATNIVLTLHEVELAVDVIAFSNRDPFDRSVTENTGVNLALTFSLEKLIARDAKVILKFELSQDGKTYRLTRPVMEISDGKPIHIKGMYLLLNGQFNPQYSTFSLIDTQVTANETISEKSAIVLRKDDNDKIALGFDAIEAL